MNEIREHELILKDRKSLKITSVVSVKDFTENELIIETNQGLMLISGNELRIENLSKADGVISISGKIDAIEYKAASGKKGIFGLFK